MLKSGLLFASFALAFLPATVSAQGSDAATPAPTMPPVSGTRITQPHLSYVEIKTGTGEVAAVPKVLTVIETMWNDDGTLFYTRPPSLPNTFTYGEMFGKSHYEEAFAGMRVGGKRRVFLSPAAREAALAAEPSAKTPPLIYDVELVALNDPPTLHATTNFIETLLEEHAGVRIMMIDARSDGSHEFFFSKIYAMSTFDCNVSIGTEVSVRGHEGQRQVSGYNLNEYDPKAIRVAATPVNDGWKELSSTFTVTADSSSGSQPLSFAMDTEENAKRLEKALSHAISICNGKNSLF